jgi:hypothetical protein
VWTPDVNDLKATREKCSQVLRKGDACSADYTDNIIDQLHSDPISLLIMALLTPLYQVLKM